jgi:Leucine rich repeat
MDCQRGDDYLRNISSFIRSNESRLAEAAFHRRRRPPKSRQSSHSRLTLNPFQWFTSDSTARSKPLMFVIDTHHLFYILARLEALGYNVGTLDVKVDNPSRPMNYVDVFHGEDTSDTMSLSSIRTSLSAISGLSLGRSLWGRPEPPNVDHELKYIFSSFTKIPAVSLRAPGPRQIAEIAGDPPNENALPLDAFRNLQSLECIDIDPRTLLGWDKLSESLWSLTVIRGGLDDVSDLFIDAVSNDAARRQAAPGSGPNGSFHGTCLPESIAENVEETVVTPIDDDLAPASSPSESPTSPQLPQSKWPFLRFLSLCDNDLTFIPTECLLHLTSLTHLDLSSNLLVSVPDGLSSLYNLVSLNLSHNMIDTVHGVYKKLGQVLSLNLSKNRLDSLCGLERLVALEHVNVGHNQLEESGEVGRLASLPNIAKVDVEGNPFTEIESDYRIKCFDFFWKEGKTILLDGTQAGFYEKTYLTSAPPEQMTSTRPVSKAYSPPVVPVGVSAAAMAVPPSSSSGASPTGSPPFSPSSSHHPSPLLSAANAKPRKRRVKRIVDLDAEVSGNAARSWVTGSEETSEYSGPPTTMLPRSPRVEPALLPSTSESEPAPVMAVSNEEGAMRPGPVVRLPPLDTVSPAPKHRRSHTECVPASATAESDDTPSPLLVSRPDPGTMSMRVTARRAAMRRGRVSASVFEAPSAKAADKVEEGMEREIKEADAYRAQIEALRSEMGEGWLKVFSQSNAVVRRPSAEPAGDMI